MLTHDAQCIKATIIECTEDELLVLIDGKEKRAQWAMSMPVVLEPEDAVLCIRSNENELFVIAPIGRPSSWKYAAEHIDIEADTLALKGDRLELTARKLFEKTIDAYRWTSNLLQWCCGRQRTLIDGQQQVRAGRIDVSAKGQVRIDGDQINLG